VQAKGFFDGNDKAQKGYHVAIFDEFSAIPHRQDPSATGFVNQVV